MPLKRTAEALYQLYRCLLAGYLIHQLISKALNNGNHGPKRPSK